MLHSKRIKGQTLQKPTNAQKSTLGTSQTNKEETQRPNPSTNQIEGFNSAAFCAELYRTNNNGVENHMSQLSRFYSPHLQNLPHGGTSLFLLRKLFPFQTQHPQVVDAFEGT